MFACTISDYTFFLTSKGLPALYHELYRSRALLVDEVDFDLPRRDPAECDLCFLAVQRKGQRDYELVVVLGHESSEPIIIPRMMFIEETKTLYLGAGERVLIYGLNPPVKIAEQDAPFGFLGWERTQDVVVMTAEMAIAAWDLAGHQLWLQVVEPPYAYVLKENNIMDLTAFDQHFSFPLHSGPVRDIMAFRQKENHIE